MDLNLTFEHRKRSSLLGASEVGTVLGVAPKSWGGPLSVWAAKVAGESNRTNAHMTWGNRLESAIVAGAAEEFGADEHHDLDHGPHDPFIVHPDYPLLGTHPDGFFRKNGQWYAVEVKKSLQPGYFGEGPDDMPPHYWAQAQAHAHLTGLPVVFAAYETWRDGLWLRVIEPTEAGRIALERAQDWFRVHVSGNVMPPLDGVAGLSYVKRAHPVVEGDVKDADDDDDAAVAAWVKAKNLLALAKEQEATAQARMLERVGPHAGLAATLGTVKWTATKGRVSLSVSELKKHPDLWSEAMSRGLVKQSEPGRRLSFKENK